MTKLRAHHLEAMAHRLVDAHRARVSRAGDGLDDPAYLRAVRSSERRQRALRRLVEALDREVR